MSITNFSLFRVTESQIGAYKNREGVERRRLREQKEGSRGAFGRSGERVAAGGTLQGGGYLRAAASSLTSLLGEDHGKSRRSCPCNSCMPRFRIGIPFDPSLARAL